MASDLFIAAIAIARMPDGTAQERAETLNDIAARLQAFRERHLVRRRGTLVCDEARSELRLVARFALDELSLHELAFALDDFARTAERLARFPIARFATLVAHDTIDGNRGDTTTLAYITQRV